MNRKKYSCNFVRTAKSSLMKLSEPLINMYVVNYSNGRLFSTELSKVLYNLPSAVVFCQYPNFAQGILNYASGTDWLDGLIS